MGAVAPADMLAAMLRLLPLLLLAALLAGADVPPDLAAIDNAVRAHLAKAGRRAPDGLRLLVFDRHDRQRIDLAWGDLPRDRPLAVASASKLVSGLTVFAAIARSQGRLTLDSTTGQVLGWSGPRAAITLRHLLSFTSGLPADAPENLKPRLSLAECVEAIARMEPDCPPGIRFEYGGTHLQVAGRMVEVATGMSWNAFFRTALADPLGLPPAVRYHSWPRQRLGDGNPLIGGGLCASMADYAALLALAFHRGSGPAGPAIGGEELFAAQAREPYAVEVGKSPAAKAGLPFRYGLCCWLEGEHPRQGVAVISSAGAFGFTPWLDREAGCYAILGMEGDPGTGTGFSMPLQQELKPLIRAALAAR